MEPELRLEDMSTARMVELLRKTVHEVIDDSDMRSLSMVDTIKQYADTLAEKITERVQGYDEIVSCYCLEPDDQDCQPQR